MRSMKIMKIQPKYDSHEFHGIGNFELKWKMTKIIFRLNFWIFKVTGEIQDISLILISGILPKMDLAKNQKWQKIKNEEILGIHPSYVL